MKETELLYQERLTIRRALEHYALCKSTVHPFISPPTKEERAEAERLQYLFKEHKIIVQE